MACEGRRKNGQRIPCQELELKFISANATGVRNSEMTIVKAKSPVLDRIYNLSGEPEECRDAYKDWAKTYDADTVDGLNYVGPAIAADRLAAMDIDRGARVLDAGCGTGLAGAELKTRGFKAIDGMDLSPEMLDVAREKKAYADLREADMTKPLPYEDDAYEAIICVGTFTHCHVGPKGFDELVRITRPGGPIVATVHEEIWDAEGFPQHLSRLEREGAIKLIEAEPADYHVNKCRLVVLETL